eukprot:TRINITY_DN2485_c0_g1_i2.p1 TRINITY_DN2485_c0_g1~~TRINITY_DN2485_c0_g1_i2.p1  ORF type:complete len:124 (-),score=17.26 TRINITY_DN2485_c0_g1_i2:130-501(-)
MAVSFRSVSLMPQSKEVPDAISYSAAISACEKGGQWQLALNLLSLMPQSKIVPDAICYNAAISACEKGGQWQLALNPVVLDASVRNSARCNFLQCSHQRLRKRRSMAVSSTSVKLDAPGKGSA